MSTRKPTPENILDDVLGVVEVDESIVEIPSFQPKKPTRRTRAPRTEVPAMPDVQPEATPPIPIIVKPVEWEYREVVFRDYSGWRVRFVDGRELSNWKRGPTLLEYLENAGNEGWELVSMSERHHNQKEAYFKRIKG